MDQPCVYPCLFILPTTRKKNIDIDDKHWRYMNKRKKSKYEMENEKKTEKTETIGSQTDWK